jgi:hypothetical protein
MNRPDTDDLSLMWDYHCHCEFGLKDVDETMSTMVAEPYVNHIATMTWAWIQATAGVLRPALHFEIAVRYSSHSYIAHRI